MPTIRTQGQLNWLIVERDTEQPAFRHTEVAVDGLSTGNTMRLWSLGTGNDPFTPQWVSYGRYEPVIIGENVVQVWRGVEQHISPTRGSFPVDRNGIVTRDDFTPVVNQILRKILPLPEQQSNQSEPIPGLTGMPMLPRGRNL